MHTKFLKSRTTLGVYDVARSIAFYEKALGFEVVTTMGEGPDFAIVARDGVDLGLVKTQAPAVEAFACCYFDVDGVEKAHAHAMAAGATLASPLTRHPWGSYDFVLQDPDGHRIALGERHA
ncbi:MAG: VOC family protein [Polyangiaceae bacterium]|nr:VOC family protein [Polyangiaceae bacterium]